MNCTINIFIRNMRFTIMAPVRQLICDGQKYTNTFGPKMRQLF